MEKYLDVLGYLLAAVVFSVSFLGARVHATYEATAREVREQSWRVRSALLHGDPVGPPELADTIAVAHRTTDRVAKLSRTVNRLLFVAMAVVYAAAIWLLGHGASGPPYGYLITSLVFFGATSVIVIGEFDVAKVGRDQRSVIARSLVGQLGELAEALTAQRWAAVGARLAALSEIYPDWALMAELRAYLKLRAGRPAEGFQQVRELARERTQLYLTPVVGTACALAADESAAALELLSELMTRQEPVRHLSALRSGLALSWAHMEVMAQEPALSDDRAEVASRLSGRAGPAPVRPAEFPGYPVEQSLVLDLNPAEIPQTAGLLLLSRSWQGGQDETEMRILAAGTPLGLALRLVLPAQPTDSGPALHDLLDLKDGAALETFGLIFLAQNRTRDALRMIEHSIRIAPGSYRTHWAMALVCNRLGWDTAADASLQKMNMLRPETPLFDLTHRAFRRPGAIDEPDGVPGPGELARYFPDGYSTIECIQLALLGIPACTPGRPATVRERFFGRLIESGLASAQPRSAQAGVLS